jgi:hypothetical protein
MTNERDPRVSQRYRELGGEEPPRKLDESILAAARRAADKPHAPLVTPVGRHRWYFSLAAAAIVVLAVAVTIHIERGQPDPESAVATRAPETQKEEPAARADTMQQAPAPIEDAKPAPKRQAASPKPAPPVFAPDPPAAAREEARSGRAAGAPASPTLAPAPKAERKAAVEASLDSPERFLERIAELRRQGKHNEADKELEEFRKRYPNYRIPESMLEKVEKR